MHHHLAIEPSSRHAHISTICRFKSFLPYSTDTSHGHPPSNNHRRTTVSPCAWWHMPRRLPAPAHRRGRGGPGARRRHLGPLGGKPRVLTVGKPGENGEHHRKIDETIGNWGETMGKWGETIAKLDIVRVKPSKIGWFKLDIWGHFMGFTADLWYVGVYGTAIKLVNRGLILKFGAVFHLHGLIQMSHCFSTCRIRCAREPTQWP